ncbi:MAG: glycosyltransferase family 2 protein [Methanobrevibacter sp.]|nr:glycosyltransferase family 2 protein [Methanobrevibacter sp.]
MVKVSVIMPVYNAEDYLKESIDCILDQTLEDWELICVDDGSKDNSLAMLNEYAANDSRIKVFHQENQGGGTARNVAITHATGDYLYCMDADDMINSDALEKLYYLALRKDLDVIIFQAINYDDKLDKTYHNDYYDMWEIADFVGDDVFNIDDLGDYIFKISVTPWCKFYNLDFVKRSDAKFAEGLIFHDNIFYWDVVFNAERMYFLREFLYTRRRHITSSTGAGDKRYISTITINNMIIERFIKYGYFEQYKEHLYNRKIRLVYRRFTEVQDQYKPFFFKNMKDDFQMLVDHELMEEALECLKPLYRSVFEDVIASKDYDEFKVLEAKRKAKPSTSIVKRVYRKILR